MPIIMEDVSHIYLEDSQQQVVALDHVTLTIEDGSFVGIIGQTGSGKSTLVQHFNALMVPSSGKIMVNGIDVSEKKRRREVRKQVGMVFQYPEYQLFDETVAKDVAFGPRNLGVPEDEIDGRVREAMQQAGLDYDEYAEKSPFELSGGEKRRAALAGILATQPSILVLDEPMAGLDPIGRRDILHFLREYHAQGHTVVMVSHSMDDIAEIASYVIVMSEGRIAMQGSVSDVFSQGEQLRELRLDKPQAALMADRLRELGMPLGDDVYRMEDLLREVVEVCDAE